jgi:hypothetical protein
MSKYPRILPGDAVDPYEEDPPVFQGLVDNEKESGFRWLLEQVHLLLRSAKLTIQPSLSLTTIMP